jgi:hypothetical protein
MQFKVQQNLFDFIRELQSNEDAVSVLLFIDAICIDQVNIKERNA